MKSYSNTQQVLSSLVINPPYKIDGFTTSPKISKILDFPIGLKVDSKVLIKSIYELVITLSSLMILSSIFIICLYLPIQNQNEQLSNTVKILTNEKLGLLVNLQEATSYNKLFSIADALSLKDSDEIIHININPQDAPKLSTNHINFKKYPSIQFSGF